MIKAQKFLTSVLCVSMAVSNITPVFASVTNDTLAFEDTDTTTLEQTEVLYDKAGSYFVTIPKIISLGADKQSPYSVKVEGDIPSDKQVYVSPIDGIKDLDGFNFYMKDQSTTNPKADVVATVTQNKFYWNFSEVADGYAETNNQVTAEDLTSGTWKGTFDFEINMHKVEPERPDFTLTTDGDVTLPVGESHQLNAYIDGVESNSDVEWSCDNEEVTINNGLIELPSDLEIGSELTITIAKDDKEVSFIITVSEPISDFTLTTDGDVTLPAGSTGQLNAYIDGVESNDDVTWSCDNEKVTINDGLVEIPSDLDAGSKLTITVAKDGKEASFTITVDKKELEAGLYDANDNLIVSWADSGIDNTCSNASGIVYRVYPNTVKVVLGDSVTSISQEAFSATSLTEVVISDSVISIGMTAFAYCTSLTKVTIPSSVTSIGTGAFMSCTSLTDVTIPSSVTSIGNIAFENVPHIIYNGSATGKPWGANSLN